VRSGGMGSSGTKRAPPCMHYVPYVDYHTLSYLSTYPMPHAASKEGRGELQLLKLKLNTASVGALRGTAGHRRPA
jgi:hypothetical protein